MRYCYFFKKWRSREWSDLKKDLVLESQRLEPKQIATEIQVGEQVILTTN